MGKGSAGDYAKTKVDTGLYGTSTTSKKGTTYDPSSFQKQLVGTVEQSVPGVLNEFINPSYNSEQYLAEQAQRQKQQYQAYDNGVLSQLANKGLMRSSGLQSATNSFADTLANQEVNAMNNYQANNANKLSTLMSLYGIPYDMMQGTNSSSQSLSNAVSNYNAQNQQLANSAYNGLYGMVGNAMGAAAGLSTGGSSTLLSGGAGGLKGFA